MKPVSLVALVLLLPTTVACGPDRDWYVRHNLVILETLPQPPGAARLAVQNSAYYRERGPLSGVPVGWGTMAVYAAAPDMTAGDVIAFYVAGMRDTWQVRVDEYPIIDLRSGRRIGTNRGVLFARDGATVSLNTENMYEGGPHTYEIGIDHRSPVKLP